jgi:hypothetical protein
MKNYDRETHERLLKIISGRDKRITRTKVIFNVIMPLLMLSFPFFLFEKSNIFMTFYKIFTAEVFSFLIILWVNSTVFPETDELINRKEITGIREILSQFLEKEEVSWLSRETFLENAENRTKDVEIFRAFEKFRREVALNVPEHFQDEIFYERMKKFFEKIPADLKNMKEKELELKKRNIKFERKRRMHLFRKLRELKQETGKEVKND